MSKLLKVIIFSTATLAVISTIGAIGYKLLNKEESQQPSEENSDNEEQANQESETAQDTEQAVDTSQSQAAEEQDANKSDYAGWTQVTFEACKVTLFYPPGWKVSTYDSPLKCADITSADAAVNMTINGEFTDDPVTYFENKPTGRPGLQEEILTRVIDGEEYPYVIETIPELGTTYYIFYKSGGTYYVSSWSGSGVSNYTSTIDKIVDSIDVL